ncbi:hypothetical protein F53441_5963 [Fusarium austroafricanum]|uniref:Adenylylsulfate kinase n=1 Tax=Fusarium austroafricanum TaxID=2364996 RepID=A0A8H4KII4_9HYPO|nr:hypothetical protein F53441_5963 [Fusarium austroafricanum]
MAAANKAPVVWINGFPGTGKLTIAKAIAKIHGHDKILVLDNHKLIDPVETRFPRGHPEYNTQRQIYRQAVLEDNVRSPSSHGHLVIFTDFQSDNQLGRDVAKEYADAASTAGRPFLPVYLTCSLKANIQRIASRGRIDSGTTKLIDADVLRDIRSRCQLFHFDGHPGLTVDSTVAPPLEIAGKILDRIKSLK